MIDFTVPETLYLMPQFSPGNQALQRLLALIQSSAVFVRDKSAAYLFCNSKKKVLRIIYWDGQRFIELIYRIDGGVFQWPTTEPKFMEISLFQIERLLRGDSLNPPLKSSFIFND
ncbi:IS66 family insertion sequence element accessory protein TnpB [Fundicoccus culcitae]|uniref:Transposase n=1 Tax=Fundicoccus culcitae TaxID=2969821 RepID=A0ABY5P4E4_9LACT|nr:IS66 family insertion sequence element accessory protein TnpB [Fundicoccus culcitae]UUX33451.1 transposase [Fundicoccus culcitae]UUX33704.1 transposase [Fundicoccus culcitae]UUX34996.1 transposase [Fundicoccus culcitae]UUX35285.1 transposase [Fundicoccus culcitae]